jgi:hypothetical protein
MSAVKLVALREQAQPGVRDVLMRRFTVITVMMSVMMMPALAAVAAVHMNRSVAAVHLIFTG